MAPKITNKRAILLTGTVIPNSIYTGYNNPEKRLQDYLKAIEFYCNIFKNEDVFFLENSEFDLDSNMDYKSIRGKYTFTMLRFPKSEKFNEGKGYQEFEMVDKAVDMLKDKYASFIKITGRYIVLNIKTITAGKCTGIVIDLNKRLKKADTYLLYFTTDFYMRFLKQQYKNVKDNEGIFIEHVIYSKIEEGNLFGYCSLFSKTPLLSGISGSYGINLKRNRLRVLVRNIERFFYNIFNIKVFFY